MMRSFSRILVVASLLASASAAGQVAPVDDPQPADTAGSDREALLILLSAYHGIPEAAAFEAAARAPQSSLWSIVEDTTLSPIFRDRALAALVYWPSEQLRSFLVGQLAAPDTTEMARHRAIGHLATAFGDSALPAISPFLGADDVQLRLTAAHALQSIDSAPARAALAAAAAVERNPLVLERLRVSP